MILMYFSAIFYPAEILPAQYAHFLDFNPLYQFIKGFRNCVYYNIGVTQENLLICIVWASVSLIVGLVLFKKNQDKFILYI